MSTKQTYAQLLSSIRSMTENLKQEDKQSIKEGWNALGLVDSRASLLTSRVPTLTLDEARGLIYMSMESVSAEGNYTENLLVEGERLSEQLIDPVFRGRILELAGKSKQFDQVASLASSLFQRL